MQRVVKGVGGAIGWVTGVSRVESLWRRGNIFVGQSESPLVVRPICRRFRLSHLFTLMSVGMAASRDDLALMPALLGERYLPFLLAAPPGVHVGAGRNPEAKLISRRARRIGRTGAEGGATVAPEDEIEVPHSRKASGRPTSSWLRRRARRPASSCGAVGAMVLASSPSGPRNGH